MTEFLQNSTVGVMSQSRVVTLRREHEIALLRIDHLPANALATAGTGARAR